MLLWALVRLRKGSRPDLPGAPGSKASAQPGVRTLASGSMRFEHVLVVGAGQMGGGIAQVVAASGRRVSLHDEVPGRSTARSTAMEKSLEKLAEKGGADPAEVLVRVTTVDDLVPADLLIEAVVEDAAVKEDDLPPRGRSAPG